MGGGVGVAGRLRGSEDVPAGQLAAEVAMAKIGARFVGAELYFEDLERARKFYSETLGLKLSEEEAGHHAKFDSGAGFVCLERKGVETYPSKDKAVLFFEVADVRAAVKEIGRERVVQLGEGWAVMHDPEGHNVVLLGGATRDSG
jgi:predicted enzyme related to lactoylglutathione lyase